MSAPCECATSLRGGSSVADLCLSKVFRCRFVNPSAVAIFCQPLGWSERELPLPSSNFSDGGTQLTRRFYEKFILVKWLNRMSTTVQGNDYKYISKSSTAPHTSLFTSGAFFGAAVTTGQRGGSCLVINKCVWSGSRLTSAAHFAV